MANTPEGISVKALNKSWRRMRQRNDTKTTKRRTKSNVTRVSCAMLSDTATSCRRSSCGERATREATTAVQLGENRLETIPPEIGRLRALKTLTVSRSFTAPRQD